MTTIFTGPLYRRRRMIHAPGLVGALLSFFGQPFTLDQSVLG